MKLFLCTLLVPVFFFTSCEKKKEHCDNAELRVKNNTADTIFFSYHDGSGYGDTLLPGGTVSSFYGSMDINDDSGFMIVNFITPQASYAIPLDECVVEKVFD
jgi:hypothetical protein